MLNQEKVWLMSQLAILEKEHGKELRAVRESFRSDYIGISMLKNALRITAVFLVLLCLWAAACMEFILDITARGELGMLGIGMLTAYIVVLLITLTVTFLCAASAYHRNRRIVQKYEELLMRLKELEERFV